LEEEEGEGGRGCVVGGHGEKTDRWREIER
jgi:hypothetical protein